MPGSRFDAKVLQAAHSAFRGRLGLQQVIILAAAANWTEESGASEVEGRTVRFERLYRD